MVVAGFWMAWVESRRTPGNARAWLIPVVLAAAFKLALVPFHVWAPGAYARGGAAVTTALAGVSTVGGLGAILVAITTAINAWSVRLMALINSVGVFVELIAAVLIAVILACNVTRGPQVFFSTHGYGAGESGGPEGDLQKAQRFHRAFPAPV